MSIVANHLNKNYGRFTALDDVSVSFDTGKLIALLGPSGSGKTTLLRLLAGLEVPDPHDRHSISFNGKDVTHIPARQRGVGFVFQHYALFRHMTVAENIAFGLNARPRATRPSKAEIKERVAELLDKVQLGGFGHRYPHQLSGGQRQRIALARALAIEPQVLLLDEPFGALDAQVRKQLRRWLREFHESTGLTTVFVTHDQEEALELADEVVILNRGKIEQRGEPQEIYDNPATEFVCEFLGHVNKLEHWGGRSNAAYVRPHEIDLTLPKHDGVERTGVVRHIFAAGPVARVTVAMESGSVIEAEISRVHLEELGIDDGDTVGIRFRSIRSFEHKLSNHAVVIPGGDGI